MKHAFGLLLLFATQFQASAQWTPLEGPATHAAQFSAGLDYIFASTYSGIFRSSDLGLHWEVVPGLPRNYQYNSVEISSDSSQMVVGAYNDACNCGHLYRSVDRGHSWQQIMTPGFAQFITSTVAGDQGYLLVSAFRFENNAYIQTIWESNDGGQNWKRNGLETLFDEVIWELQPSNNRIWGLSGNILFSGTQDGKDWAQVSVSPDSVVVQDYLVFEDTILLTTITYGTLGDIHLWRSTDSGRNWDLIQNALSLIRFQRSNNILYSKNSQKLIKSKDGGLTWETQNQDPTLSNQYLVKGQYVFAYDYENGVVRSEDYGKHYSALNERLGYSSTPWKMALFGDDLFVICPRGNSKEQLQRFDTQAESWNLLTNIPQGHYFAEHYSDAIMLDGKLFLLETSEIVRSDDLGETWIDIAEHDFPSSANVNGNGMFIVDHSLFVYNGYNNSTLLFRSDDYGQNWIDLAWPAINPCKNIQNAGEFAGKIGDHIFIALRGAQCIFKSDDLGGSWESLLLPDVPIDSDTGFTYIRSMVTAGNNLLLNLGRRDKGVKENFSFVSNDLGASWHPSDVPIGSDNNYYSSRGFGLGDFSLLSNYYEGVLVSVDSSGQHWSTFNEGLPSVRVLDIEKDELFLYAAVWGHGVWKRPLADLEELRKPKVDDGNKLKITYGPNPCTGYFRLETDPPVASAHLQWYDLSGRLLLEQDVEFTCNQSIIELPFRNGGYIFRLSSDTGSAHGKLLLIR